MASLRLATPALAAALALVLAMPAAAEPKIGAPAPAFQAVDSNGKTHSLADFKGKTVILEWTNHDCPYVRKHYNGNNMQALQKDTTGQGVVWLSVISSAPGEQGHVEPAMANKLTETRGAAPTAVLLDPEGKVGRAYDAKVTPHMYVINPEGTLVYMGGIDDKPSTNPETLKGANNYVRAALANMAAGKPVDPAVTRAYGCTVKYPS